MSRHWGTVICGRYWRRTLGDLIVTPKDAKILTTELGNQLGSDQTLVDLFGRLFSVNFLHDYLLFELQMVMNKYCGRSRNRFRAYVDGGILAGPPSSPSKRHSAKTFSTSITHSFGIFLLIWCPDLISHSYNQLTSKDVCMEMVWSNCNRFRREPWLWFGRLCIVMCLVVGWLACCTISSMRRSVGRLGCCLIDCWCWSGWLSLSTRHIAFRVQESVWTVRDASCGWCGLESQAHSSSHEHAFFVEAFPHLSSDKHVMV